MKIVAVSIFIPIFVVISTIVNIIVIKLILSKKEQTNQKMTWLAVGNNICVGLWIIITSFQAGPLSEENNLVGFTISAFISNLLILIGMCFLSIFVTYLIKPTVSLNRLMLFCSTISSVATLYVIMIIEAMNENKSMVDLTLTLVNILNLIVVISFLMWIHRDFTIFMDEIKDPETSTRVMRFYLAIIIGLVGNIPILLLAWFVNQTFLSLTYLILPISMSFLIYNYYKDPRVAFILPERTYLAIVTNSNGGLKYEKLFWNFRGNDFTIIISGVLNAVTNIMSEFYDQAVQPRLIEFENKRILLKWQDEYFLAVFTDRDSPLIRTAMDETVKAINSKYGSDLKKHMNSANILDLDKMFESTFYFVLPS